ncbi:MAG: hypothetical protein AAGA61_10480, partial [Pseudomonadota bacterium]
MNRNSLVASAFGLTLTAMAVISLCAGRFTPTRNDMAAAVEAADLQPAYETLLSGAVDKSIAGPGTSVAGGDASGAYPISDEQRAAAHAKMSPPLAALVNSGASETVSIIVRARDSAGLLDTTRVEALGGTTVRSFSGLNMQVVRLPLAAAEALALDTRVSRLSLDGVISASSVAARMTANVPTDSSADAQFDG